MNAPRKVFVATSLKQNEINEIFQWPEGFERTLDRDEAEFIIFDASNVPNKWSNYIAEKPAFYVPNLNLPVLFVALGGNTGADFEHVKKHFTPVELPIYKTKEELCNALQWFQSILPFYNQTKTPEVEKVIRDFLLGKVKA